MNPAQVPCDLLTQFNAVRDCVNHDFGQSVRMRGVAWVLRWAVAIVVLCFTGCVLAEFAYSLAAELTLARAARAGALEATLPQATYRSVGETVRRRLAERASWAGQLKLAVQRNGAAVGGAMRAAGGDQMTVTLAVPLRTVLPRWLCAFSFRTASQIEVRAVRNVPGEELRPIRASRAH
ncbi:MAG TPA: hypothetical protein VHK01_15745 [Lacipirellulaceae bacterium]|jgi:hypothetical protein|nr:hypothetical protein [Lacipirellulaceae bacterium]